MATTAITYWDGDEEASAVLGRWNGTAMIDASVVNVMPGGWTIDLMLQRRPFYMAHRGGSANWPEMSMYGFTQSVAWGAMGLEISLARTSDGVWFGLHDQTLDRTSGTVGAIAANMTWAQVLEHPITQFGMSEPYLRFEDLLDVYAGSHVIFCDPKYAISFASEMFAIMKRYPDWQTRFVAKYFWDATSFAVAARAAGFITWGYYYQVDADNIADSAHNWDLIGMDYTADQHSWDLAIAPGKPVIAHILPTAASATTALAKGADGFMISGIKQVIGFPAVWDA